MTTNPPDTSEKIKLVVVLALNFLSQIPFLMLATVKYSARHMNTIHSPASILISPNLNWNPEMTGGVNIAISGKTN